jgi:hypothetical protein
MSMDRLRRVLAGIMLAIMLGTMVAAAGCRSTRSEVPPGPKYSTTGDPSTSMFNSAPHQYTGAPSVYPNSTVPGQPAMPGAGGPGGASDGLPSGLGSGASGSSFGTPPPNSPAMNQPTNNAFGPPGTSGA